MHAALLPTGAIADVAATGLDLRQPAPLAEVWARNDPQITLADGIDHCFLPRPIDDYRRADPSQLVSAATCYAPTTGIQLHLRTNQPGFQCYTGNHLPKRDAIAGKDGAQYRYRHGFCLETQQLPDAPNQPGFPSPELRPGQTFHAISEFDWSSRS